MAQNIFYLLLFICLIGLSLANRGILRNDKFLNVFQIVQFPNSPCNATSSTQGTCYTSAECTTKGGENGGSCANGFGVCCVFVKGCGTTTSENNSYFSSATYSSPCILKVCRANSGICQLRLDFDTFDIAQPESATTPIVTNCIDARFSATAKGASIPVLCGTNTGKHMYLEALDNCNELQFTTRPGTTNPNYNIRISQIACTASFKAPQGCLQFHTGVTGTIDSFNVDGGVHLADHEYTICIRTEEGYCGVTIDDTIFSLSAGGTTEGDDCTEDYIIIPDNAKNNNRYCGNGFQSTDTFQRPYEIAVHFDGADTATNRVLGFKLTYTQTMTDCA